MATQNEFYKELLDNIYDGVYFVDVNRIINFWNKGAERLSGYKASEIIGSSCMDNILLHIGSDGNKLCKTRCPLAKVIVDGSVYEADVYLHHKDGQRVPVSVHASPIKEENGRIIGAVEIFRDNSSRLMDMKLIEDLKKAALLDPLTGIPNRRYIEMKMHSCLEELKRHNIIFGIFFADVDHFKQINDTYGHIVGDDILKMVANTLKGNVRTSDLVGRLGGEEFVGVISHIDEEKLKQLGNKLRMLVENCFLDKGNTPIKVTVTLGITLGKPDDTMESIIGRADQLLYKGKESGRNCVVWV